MPEKGWVTITVREETKKRLLQIRDFLGFSSLDEFLQCFCEWFGDPDIKLYDCRIAVGLKPRWVWNKRIEEIFRERIIGSCLHVACGKSTLGDVRLDANRYEVGPNIIGDMFHLPFRDRSFDTVISDPPYKLAYDKRPWFARELARVARKRIVVKLDWIPFFPGFKLTEVIVYQGKRYWAHVSFILVYDRFTPRG